MPRESIRLAHWQAWLAGAATLASLAALARPAAAASAVTCTYTVTNTWAGGFSANVDITNNGPAISGWTLRWTFLTPTSGIAGWAAVITEAANRATATNMSWNGAIPTGRIVSFGWVASAGTTAVPTDLAINGQPC